MSKLMKILILVAVCLAVGYLSSEATQSGVDSWYPTLEKPIFNPPSWVFGPVWTALYIMMGVAGGLVWSRIDVERDLVRKGMIFFIIQLALNMMWSFLFFKFHNLLLALIEIIILWFMIFETYVVFKRVDKIAGYLLIPYLAWVAFATVLNGSLWWLNR
ncbi:MAG: tryptophan-rich sensory protein [Flavobacterium sp.]|nr:tryptophan-rich sensory protein [Flavobacterium sp.]